MLDPIRMDDDATKVVLSFQDDENTLENIENQKTIAKVTHEVQTTGDVLAGMTKTTDMGNAIVKWKHFTYKRDPVRIQKNISSLDPKPQKVDAYGMTVSKYGDEVYLTDYVKEKSTIEFPATVMKSMEYGFVRLETRNKFAAMVNPVRWRYTPNWKKFGVQTDTIELPYSRIVAFFSKQQLNVKGDQRGVGTAQNGVYLAMPGSIGMTQLMRKFTDYNVPPGILPHAPLTPNLLEQIIRTPEYQNKENIYHQVSDERNKSFVWRFIRWVRCTPEVMPGAFYGGSKFKVGMAGANVGATGETLLSKDGDGMPDNVSFVLDAKNHEVIPMWLPMNITKTTDKSQDRFRVIRIPILKDTPVLFRERSIGGCREQNILQLNLCIPKYPPA